MSSTAQFVPPYPAQSAIAFASDSLWFTPNLESRIQEPSFRPFTIEPQPFTYSVATLHVLAAHFLTASFLAALIDFCPLATPASEPPTDIAIAPYLLRQISGSEPRPLEALEGDPQLPFTGAEPPGQGPGFLPMCCAFAGETSVKAIQKTITVKTEFRLMTNPLKFYCLTTLEACGCCPSIFLYHTF